MKMDDIINKKEKKEETVQVVANIPVSYRDKIREHNINYRKLICAAVDELELP